MGRFVINSINDEKIPIYIRIYYAVRLVELEINNDNLVKALIDFICNKNNDSNERTIVAKYLIRLGKNDLLVDNALVNFIVNNNISDSDRENVAKTLLAIERNDDLVNKALVNFIENNNISNSNRIKVAEALAKLGRNDDLVVKTLIDLIKNKGINYANKTEAIEVFANIEKVDLAVKALTDLIKDKTIYFSIKRYAIEFLSELESNNNLVAEVLVYFFKNFPNNNIVFLNNTDLENALAKLGSNNNLVLKTYIEIIKNKNIEFNDIKYFWSKIKLAKVLSKIDRNDEWFVNILIDIIKDKKNRIGVRVNVAKALAKLTKTRYNILEISKTYYRKFFAKYSDTKAVFKAFKEGIVNIDFVIVHCIYNQLTIYLKDNKLCIVYEGEELILKKVSKSYVTIKIFLLKIGRSKELEDHLFMKDAIFYIYKSVKNLLKVKIKRALSKGKL